MPVVFPPSGFGCVYQVTAKGGVTVTSSATPHAMGAWIDLINPLDYDLFGLSINASAVAAGATDTRMLGDIGIAPTGGGSEQVVIPFLDWGASAALVAGGKTWFFPLYVPKGKAVRARCQALAVSDTVLIVAHGYTLPPHGFAEDAPQEWTQYGALSASSQGAAVTSGSGVFGTEVQVTASTARAHRWFHVSIGFGTNTAVSAGRHRVRLARDTAAAEIIGIWDFTTPTAGEDICGPLNMFPACMPIPSGSPLYVDIDGSGAEAMTVIVHAY